MKYNAALKYVRRIICDSQLAAIEAVRATFINGKTTNSTPHKTSLETLIQMQEAPERYWIPTSEGDQENQPVITSKGAIQKILHTFTKKKNIKINSADDHEPIARRTISSIDKANLQPTQTIQNISEPIADRTRS